MCIRDRIEEDEYYEEAYYENLGVDPLYFINSAMTFHDIFNFEHTVFNFDIEYQPVEGQFFFARVASGYRSGGANDRFDLIGGDFFAVTSERPHLFWPKNNAAFF